MEFKDKVVLIHLAGASLPRPQAGATLVLLSHQLPHPCYRTWQINTYGPWD